VVLITIFAAETFDPRLMWDAAAATRIAHQAQRQGALLLHPRPRARRFGPGRQGGHPSAERAKPTF
jgi:hypothetical protein